jgi:uncharacterized protein
MEYETRTVYVGNKRLKADVADTMTKRARGLSGREKLGSGECMLFIFPYSAIYPIWMRGMKFPIDILWIDQKKRITDFRTNLKPASGLLDFKTYSHNGSAKYAIELPAGFIKRNGIKINSRIKF